MTLDKGVLRSWRDRDHVILVEPDGVPPASGADPEPPIWRSVQHSQVVIVIRLYDYEGGGVGSSGMDHGPPNARAARIMPDRLGPAVAGGSPEGQALAEEVRPEGARPVNISTNRWGVSRRLGQLVTDRCAEAVTHLAKDRAHC